MYGMYHQERKKIISLNLAVPAMPRHTEPSYRLNRLLDAATSINAILREQDYPETILMQDELDGALAEYYQEIGRTEEYHYDPEILPSPERLLELVDTMYNILISDRLEHGPHEGECFLSQELEQTLSDLRKAVKG